MGSERAQLEAGIAALEAQRPLLGAALAEAALAPLRARLLALGGEAPAQTLRQASILFLDVVGSTRLSQQLDPEQIHAAMDGMLAGCTALVQAHGGRVLQYAGDSLLAAFGADGAREDDAVRAVRCGLALLDEGRSRAAAVARSHGHAGFGVRVGVHTGQVLLGGGVDAEGSIRGIAVNIAARMEQSAPPGGLRISHDTYLQVRGLFELQAQPPLSVKGLDRPLRSYLVIGERSATFRMATRGIEGVSTPMIGRDAQLDSLQQAFNRLLDQRRLHRMTVVAEAGVGKSRLLDEFMRGLAAQARPVQVLQARATPQTESRPYGLLRDLVAAWAQIDDAASMAQARSKLEQGLVALLAPTAGAGSAQMHAHLLGHLIGLDFSDSPHVAGIVQDARQIRQRGFHAAAQWLDRLVRGEGLWLALLEDLHWADEGSLDFIDGLDDGAAGWPLLLIGLTRPVLFERRPQALAGTRIELQPLDTSESKRLADALLWALPEVPAGLSELVASRAEGNPFYLEELVRMLRDRAEAADPADHPEQVLMARVPSTLTLVIQARLDALPAPERLALQQASVIGLVFWDQALAALDPVAVDRLPALVRRGLVVPRESARIAGSTAFAFRHQILQQVTYDTLLRGRRRELHGRAARWLASGPGARASDLLGVTAEHYAQAGLDAEAAEYHTRAAEDARLRYAHEVALSQVAKALALSDGAAHGPDQEARRWRLLDVRERTLDLLGRRSEQRADLDALERLADAAGDLRRCAQVAWRRGMLANRAADYAEQAAQARRAADLAERADDLQIGIDAQCQLALALVYLGAAETARSLARGALDEARRHGLLQSEQRLLNALATMAARQGDVVAALELNRAELEVGRRLGNRANEAITLVNQGASLGTLGCLEPALQALQQGLALAREVGNRVVEPFARALLSQLSLWLGDAAQALEHAKVANLRAEADQAPDVRALALCALGAAELALGRHAEAAESARAADELATSIGHDFRFDALALRAQVALAQHDPAAALRLLEPLWAHLDEGGTLAGCNHPPLIELTAWRVRCRADPPRAAALLAQAHAALQARAAAISDADLRRSFLESIPEHRQLVAAWQAHGA